MNTTLIRPGHLVSLKTTLRGGVTYDKRTIEYDHLQGDKRVAKWETTREIADADEHERGHKARSKARHAVARVCCNSSFGLLCPLANREALTEAIAEARRISDEFNATARFSRLEVYVMTGQIADNDMEATKAIASDVRELIAAMEAGVRKADPKAIREAADRAREVAGMLSDDAKKKVSAAIAEVRGVASEIVRRVEKAGVTAASVVEGIQLRAIDAARFAVLDTEEVGESVQVAPVAPGIDLEPAAPSAPSAPAPSVSIDL